MSRSANGRTPGEIIDRRWLEDAAGWLLLAGSAAMLCLLGYHSVHFPIDYDESYNLQVVDLLAQGKGYASYGVFRGQGPWMFDPYITTGPVILLPMATIWAMSGGSVLAVRLFMLSILCICIAALYLLLRPGRRPLAFAMATAALLSVEQLQSARLLGEVPAAVLLLLAAAALVRERVFLAALAVGLAIQTKVPYGLAGVVLLSASLLHWRQWGRPTVALRNLLGIALLAAAPTLAFEIYRHASLGSWQAYLQSIREYLTFLDSQHTRGNWQVVALLRPKAEGLFTAIPLAAWLAAGLVLAWLVPAIAHRLKVHGLQGTAPVRRNVLVALGMLVLAGLAMLFGWVTQSNEPSARQGLPFLLLTFPALMAIGGTALGRFDSLLHQYRPVEVISRSVLVLCTVLLLCALGMHGRAVVTAADRLAVVSADQRQLATILRREQPASMYAEGWWQNPEYQILARVPALPRRTGDRQVLLVQGYQASSQRRDRQSYRNQCARIVYDAPRNFICWLPESTEGAATSSN
jgi:hypothetical protein